MEILKKPFKVQIFATDIDNNALEIARKGSYPVNIEADISPERLKRFFIKENTGANYVIHKKIREMIIFSCHNLIKDPPFSRLQLITCRNLLIYLEPKLQKKLIPLFHYSLNTDGFLFLGSSEKTGGFENLFSPISAKYKIYQRKETFKADKLSIIGDFITNLSKNNREANNLVNNSSKTNHILAEIVEKTLLLHYQPTALLITRYGEILYIKGRTSMFLEIRPGEINVNILKIANSGLRQKLKLALNKAVKQDKPVFCPELKIKSHGNSIIVNLTLRRAISGINLEGNELFLVILEEVKEAFNEVKKVENATDTNNYANKRIKQLKQELKTSNEELQINLEETETSNEELKSINEEMQSMNEELQSSNEELETSREELQSGNEKVNKINTELETKVNDLLKLNNDMNNLLSATGMGTIFVDTEQKIKRFTSGATLLINLIEADVGRPLGHIVSKIRSYKRLEEDIERVLDTLIPIEIEVQSNEGIWYLLRIQPYRSTDNHIEGALITFTDITTIKKMKETLQESESLRRLAVVVRDSNDAIIMQDFEGRILSWNPCAEKLYGWSEAEALKMNIQSLMPENQDLAYSSPENREISTKAIEPYNMQRLCRDGKIINVSMTATALLDDSGEIYAISTTERLIEP